MEIDNLLSINSVIIIQTIVIGLINLVVPFIFTKNIFLRNVTLILVSIIYFINILNLDNYYLNGGRTIFEIATIGVFSIKFYIEGIGLIFLTMISALWIISTIYSIGYLSVNGIENQPRFLLFMNLSIMCASLVAFSANLITLFIFYEILTLATLPLILHGLDISDPYNYSAFKKYITVLFGSSFLFFLPAILFIEYKVGLNDFIPTGILENKVSIFTAKILFLMCIFGCAKAALIFVHGWLPAAMVASYPVSALLHAVAVVKVGIFTICKITVYIFGLNFISKVFGENNFIIYIPILTILYSSIKASTQSQIKNMLAYSTIAQLSFALLGVFTFTSKGLIAAIFHMLSHSFAKASLFFSAGNFYSLLKVKNIEDLRGVSYKMLLSYKIFFLASLSLIGLPPFAGFISKYYIISAATEDEFINYLLVLIIIFSTICTSYYLLNTLYIGRSKKTYYGAEIAEKTDNRNMPASIEFLLPISMKFSIILCILPTFIFIILSKDIMRFLEFIY